MTNLKDKLKNSWNLIKENPKIQENLEYLGKSGVKALRDALVVGGVVYLISEAGDNTIDESVINAKMIGGIAGLCSYWVRLLDKYAPNLNTSRISRP